MADMMYGSATGVGGDLSEDNASDYYGSGYAASGVNNSQPPRPRLPGLYVGNLTWWTTDQDVINAINSSGVSDVQEVKFFENRNNGQSKGFCLVTFASEASLPIVMEKLPKIELHGQNPVVTPYNRQNLSLFEAQTKPRPQVNSNNVPNPQTGIMGINSISGVHAAAAAAAVGAQAPMPYAGVNAYNPLGATRNPSYHSNMRMPIRAPRSMMRGQMPGAMNNNPMMPGSMNNSPMIPIGGHQMNRMRFMPHQQQGWNNSQGGAPYNQASRMPQYNMDVSSRLDDRQSRLDDRSQRHIDDRPMRDDRSSKQDDRSDRSRRDDRPSRHREEERPRRDERSSRDERRDDRRDDRREERREDRREEKRDDRRDERREERRDDRREDRREEKLTSSSSSSRRDDKTSSRRDKSHRSDERARSRSRSRDRKDRESRRDKRERY